MAPEAKEVTPGQVTASAEPVGPSSGDGPEAAIREALHSGRFEEAAGIAIRTQGHEVLRYLIAMTRSEADGQEVYSQCCEDLWRGIRGFRGEGTFRGWMFRLARNAAHRFRRDPYRRRSLPAVERPEVAELEALVRSSTATYLRTDVRDGVQRLRERLDPDDQMLLTLRYGDRKEEWKDIARVFLGDDAGPDELKAKAAALRKRFERLKEDIREAAKHEGLI